MVFGNLGNMGEMIKQAREMQNNLKKIKEELKRSQYEVEMDGIRVVVDGEMEIKTLTLNPSLDSKKLEESAKKAVNKAIKTAKDDAANKLKTLTGGLSIPGLT